MPPAPRPQTRPGVTAVAASAAALKASNALGGARRSGQAAAEKALGSLMRVGGLTTKTSKKDEVGRSLTKEEEELQAVLALSLKEFEDQHAKDAKVVGEERDDGSPDLKRLESDPIDQPLQDFLGMETSNGQLVDEVWGNIDLCLIPFMWVLLTNVEALSWKELSSIIFEFQVNYTWTPQIPPPLAHV